MRFRWGVGTILALTAAAGLVATADAKPRRHARRALAAVEEPLIEAAPLPPPAPDPLNLALGSPAANIAASSYYNPFYGYGSYYAPSTTPVAAQPGYGYFGY